MQQTADIEIGDRVRIRTAIEKLAGVGPTRSLAVYTSVSPGDEATVHEIDTEGRLWVRLHKPLVEPGSLWPLRPELLDRGRD